MGFVFSRNCFGRFCLSFSYRIMIYNPYKNISEEDFLNLESRLVSLRNVINRIIDNSHFTLTPHDNPDALAVGIRYDHDSMKGGIGISFDDEPGSPTFSCHLIKSYDTSDKRYFLKEYIIQHITISEVENTIISLMEKAQKRYMEIKKADLKDFLEFEHD
jgi:hypothetical protein